MRAEKLNSTPDLATCIPMFGGFQTEFEADAEASPQSLEFVANTFLHHIGMHIRVLSQHMPLSVSGGAVDNRVGRIA